MKTQRDMSTAMVLGTCDSIAELAKTEFPKRFANMIATLITRIDALETSWSDVKNENQELEKRIAALEEGT